MAIKALNLLSSKDGAKLLPEIVLVIIGYVLCGRSEDVVTLRLLSRDFDGLMRTFERSICSDAILNHTKYLAVNSMSEECCITESIYRTCEETVEWKNVTRLTYPWLRELDFRLRITTALIELAPDDETPVTLKTFAEKYATPPESEQSERNQRLRLLKNDAMTLLWKLRDVVAHVPLRWQFQAQRAWLERLDVADCSIMILFSEWFSVMLNARLATDDDPLFKCDDDMICVFESVALQQGPYFTCYALGSLSSCRKVSQDAQVDLHDWIQAIMLDGVAACHEWEQDLPLADPSMQSVIIQSFIRKAGLRDKVVPGPASQWWDVVKETVEKRLAAYKI